MGLPYQILLMPTTESLLTIIVIGSVCSMNDSKTKVHQALVG